MTLEERRLLENFLGQLMQVPAIQRDRAAAAAIDSAFERQPQAAYLVVQRALLVQQELEASQAEISRLRTQLGERQGGETGAAGGTRSFLDASAWGRRGGAAAPARSLSQVGGATGSFLGQAAAVAAGVAGGAFLFQGLNHLLGADSADAGPATADAQGADVPTDADWSADASEVDAGFDGGDFLA